MDTFLLLMHRVMSLQMDHSNKEPIYATRYFPPGSGTPSNASTIHKPPLRYATRDFPPGCGNPSNAFRMSFKNPLNGSSSRQVQEIRNDVQRDPTPREKVDEVLRIYEEVYNQLKRDKEARRGEYLHQVTDRIDLDTRTMLERMGKVVNSENRIGSVPGIEVGKEFKYKTQLQVVGLHFKPMCGIDYMEIKGVLFATCVVSSEGYDYGDKFGTDVVEYTGEGGNVISKRKQPEDQKMVRGNLALRNSMEYQKPVRVVRGYKSLDGKGKLYVYCGLYLVEDCWPEPVDGKSVFKFRLRRMH